MLVSQLPKNVCVPDKSIYRCMKQEHYGIFLVLLHVVRGIAALLSATSYKSACVRDEKLAPNPIGACSFN